jgi:hypothetical protein
MSLGWSAFVDFALVVHRIRVEEIISGKRGQLRALALGERHSDQSSAV